MEKPYRLEGNAVIDLPIPTVGNLIYDELGQAVLAKLDERFPNQDRIAFQTKPKEGQPITHSNTLRALAIDQILDEETSGEIHVLTPEEVVQYWGKLPDRSNTYADTKAVSVFPNEGPNETLRKRVLEILNKDNTTVPLLVTGLGVEPSENDPGFTFVETDHTEAIEAPFLQKDQRVRYDPNAKTLVPTDDNKGVYIWTPIRVLSPLFHLCPEKNDRLCLYHNHHFSVSWLLCGRKFTGGRKIFNPGSRPQQYRYTDV